MIHLINPEDLSDYKNYPDDLPDIGGTENLSHL